MAQRKRRPTRKTKKKKTGKTRTFRFELGWPGIAGIGVVLFCLFLWMFLIGIWAGQTILLPPTTPRSTAAGVATIEDRAKIRIEERKEKVRRAREPREVKSAAAPETRESDRDKKNKHAAASENLVRITPGLKKMAPAGHYFTLQVGAYRDGAMAREKVAALKKEHKRVYLIPALEGDDALVRVCIGRFRTREDAVAYEKNLAASIKKPYVARLPAWRLR